jgi:hypothetical protein
MIVRALLAVAMLSLFTAGVRADAASDFARHKLDLQLREARAERDATPRLWPILTFAVGAVAVVTGSVFGAANALGCDGRCPTQPWASLAAVSGALVGTVGAVWWVRTEHELWQLDLRIRRLEQELQDQRLRGAAGEFTTGSSAQLRLRFTF